MKKTVFALAMLLLFTASASFAATPATDNMVVDATVASECTVATTPMHFGSLGLTFVTVDANATATITYTCTNGATPATIRLGQGSNDTLGTAAAPQRQMIGGTGTDLIRYDLYSVTYNNTVWGNTAGTSKAATADGAQHTATVYGVARHAAVPVGSYTDTVVVDLDY